MRLIDADALLDTLDCSDRDLWTKYTIDEAPTIDAVPVVRCADCKHWHEETGYCDNHSYFIGIDGMSCSPAESPSWTTWDEDDFCSDGERKDGEGNG